MKGTGIPRVTVGKKQGPTLLKKGTGGDELWATSRGVLANKRQGGGGMVSSFDLKETGVEGISFNGRGRSLDFRLAGGKS